MWLAGAGLGNKSGNNEQKRTKWQTENWAQRLKTPGRETNEEQVKWIINHSHRQEGKQKKMTQEEQNYKTEQTLFLERLIKNKIKAPLYCIEGEAEISDGDISIYTLARIKFVCFLGEPTL